MLDNIRVNEPQEAFSQRKEFGIRIAAIYKWRGAFTMLEKKIIYYDSKGRKMEKDISPELQKAILRVFNGQFKCVERTTGGLGLALPNGIKFKTESNVLIRLNCKDFSPKTESAIDASENRPKYLPIDRISEGFAFSADEKQRYVVDFGRGIVPVCVVDFLSIESVKDMAIFLEIGWETKNILQPYWIPKECLRWAREAEWQRAISHYEKLAKAGQEPIPSFLERGSEIKVASNVPMTLEWLKTKVQSNLRAQNQPLTLSATINLSDGGGLIPFGLFERS